MKIDFKDKSARIELFLNTVNNNDSAILKDWCQLAKVQIDDKEMENKEMWIELPGVVGYKFKNIKINNFIVNQLDALNDNNVDLEINLTFDLIKYPSENFNEFLINLGKADRIGIRRRLVILKKYLKKNFDVDWVIESPTLH